MLKNVGCDKIQIEVQQMKDKTPTTVLIFLLLVVTRIKQLFSPATWGSAGGLDFRGIGFVRPLSEIKNKSSAVVVQSLNNSFN